MEESQLLALGEELQSLSSVASRLGRLREIRDEIDRVLLEIEVQVVRGKREGVGDSVDGGSL